MVRSLLLRVPAATWSACAEWRGIARRIDTSPILNSTLADSDITKRFRAEATTLAKSNGSPRSSEWRVLARRVVLAADWSLIYHVVSYQHVSCGHHGNSL